MNDNSTLLLAAKKLTPDAILPSQANNRAAGLDLVVTEDAYLQPGETRLIKTGIAMEIPDGYVGIIRTRSSSFKRGIITQGTIDSDYRGEIYVVVTNIGDGPVCIEVGKAIAQMIIVPYLKCHVEAVEKLSDTDRGTQGWGSTGKAI